MEIEFDVSAINAMVHQLGATKVQVRLAYNRALKLTGSKLNTLSKKTLDEGLKFRLKKHLQRRIKTQTKKQSDGMNSSRLWYGENDVPVGLLKGKIEASKTNGVKFRDKSYPKAFVKKKAKNPKSAFERVKKDRFPIKEIAYPIKPKVDKIVEQQIFSKVEGYFWKAFEKDIEARVLHGIGQS